MKRAEILQAAEKCVCGHREQDYGTPEDNFKIIAAFWSAYKGIDFTATDVSMMMALLKIARIKSGTGTEDSFIDLAGYAACGGEIAGQNNVQQLLNHIKAHAEQEQFEKKENKTIMDTKEKHPSCSKMKIERRALVKQLSPETAVNVLLACLDYLETGIVSTELSPIEQVAFSAFAPDLEEELEKYITRGLP